MSPQELFDKYFGSMIDPEEVIEFMWRSSSSRSYVKGATAECSFKRLVHGLGWKAEKVDDQDLANRYDFNVFDVVTPKKIYRFEVKILMPQMNVDIGFRDYRDVPLPNGLLWKTKARSLLEDFDYLAICLVNFEKFNIDDFLFIHFKELPHFKTRNRKNKKFTKEESHWIRDRYVASRIVLPGLLPVSPYFNDLKLITLSECH